MGKGKYAKEPLLFIHQPTIDMPEAKMQHNYVTPKDTKHYKKEVNEHEQKEPRKIKRRYINNPLENRDKSDELMSEVNTENSSNHDSQTFKDMRLIDKIKYLSSRPERAPKLKCEIEMENKKMQGVITHFKDERVFIQRPGRVTSTDIQLEEIKDISILGLL